MNDFSSNQMLSMITKIDKLMVDHKDDQTTLEQLHRAKVIMKTAVVFADSLEMLSSQACTPPQFNSQLDKKLTKLIKQYDK